jgi:hypothetical protein
VEGKLGPVSLDIFEPLLGHRNTGGTDSDAESPSGAAELINDDGKC